jgi:hypothetical protein
MRKCPLCKNELTGKPRTIPQNNYIHLLIGVAADRCGNTLQEMKIIFSQKYLADKWKEVRFGGQTYLIPPSTSDLTKEEMSEYIDSIIRKCLKLGMTNLPLINDTY